jgi:endogenous inhibitor of DNA gyrase (YacG/DUF329 family)
LIDLGDWLSERNRVAGDPVDEFEQPSPVSNSPRDDS